MLSLFGFVKKKLEMEGKLPDKWKDTDESLYTGYTLVGCSEANTKDLESQHIFYGSSNGATLRTNCGVIPFSTAESWEFATHFIVGGGGHPSIFSEISSSEHARFALSYQSGDALRFFCGGNHTGAYPDTYIPCSVGKEIYFRVKWQGGTYYFEYSADGQTYTPSRSWTSSNPQKDVTSDIGFGCFYSWNRHSSSYNSRAIYMDDTYLKIDGRLYWKPF